MTEVPYPSDIERLRDNIRAELQAQRAMRNLDVDDRTLDGVADAITSNVDYAFAVEWCPRWVSGDEPHRWSEASGDAPTTWFVECLTCKRITSHSSQIDADDWWERHQAEHA